jgi:hypothetical protein
MDVIAQQSLDVLQDVLPQLRVFTTDFSDEIAVAGATVTTRVATQQSSGDLSTGYATNAQTVTTTAKQITVGAVTGNVIQFTDEEVSKSSIDLMELFVVPGINAVANDMMDDALALVTNANFGAAAFTGAAGDFDADDVADLAQVLSTAKVPRNGRFLMVKPTYYAALAKDNAIQAAYAFGGTEAIRDNRVPRVHGFDIVEYTDIPANAENLVGLCGAKQGIIIAARAPAIPAGFSGEVRNITDPESGLTLQLRKWYSEDDGVYRMSIAGMWGVAVGVSANIKRLVSA